MEKHSALLVGATGLIGGHCLQLLLGSEQYEKVSVLVRRPLGLKHPKLNEHIVDFEALEAGSAIFAVNDVYCCLGTTIKTAGSQAAFRKVDFDYPLSIAKLTKSAGAEQMQLVSSMGADIHSKMFYTRVKGEIEQQLQNVGFHSLHIFRPSLLLGKRPGQDKRFGEAIGQLLMPKLNFLLQGSWQNYRAIEAQIVAKAMVKAAVQGNSGNHVHCNKEIHHLAQME